MFRFPPWRRRRPEGPPGAGERGALPEGSPGAGERGALPQHPPGAAGSPQPQPQVRSSPSGIRGLGRDFGDKPDVPRQARNGNVPREGTDRPRRRAPLPPRAGNREDEEGEPSSNSWSRNKDKDSVSQNGNVPREGMDRSVRLPSVRAVSGEDEKGESSSNSRSRATDKDKGSAMRNGNVPKEGTDRPRRRAPAPPPIPPRARNREDEEGEPSSNSRSRDMGAATRNGNVPREGMDHPVCVPAFWIVSGQDEEGEPSSNSRSRGRDTDKDKDSATRNGNVPKEGMDRPRPRCRVPPPLPPWAGRREDEEGEPSSNSRSRDMGTATRNGNVLKEGTDRPVCVPSVWAVSGEDEEGEPSSNSQSRDKGSAMRNGNVPREGTDRPRRRAPAPPPIPPRAGRREDEEGEPSSNSQSRNKDSATRNGNVPREGTDRPVCVPRVWAPKREDEEGEPSSNSQSEDKDGATRNGNVPREGTDRPVCVPAFWVCSGQDEEGEPSSNSQSRGRDTAAAASPGRDRRTEPPSGAERREWLWQRLLQLGEDMQSWQGKPTAELAAGLARRIAGTPLGSYPEGPGTRSARRERGSRASPDRGIPGGNYRSLLRMLRASGSTESAEEDSGWEQSPGASPDCDTPSGNDRSFLGMLRVVGNAESAEEDSGLEQEQEQDPEQDEDQEQDEDEDQDQAALNAVQAPSRLELRFPEVWARSRLDCGRVAEEEQLHGAPVPFQRQRPLRPHKERQMAELLQEYLEQGIVVEGTSESNNPLILYQKPHGRGVRLSLDCAALNDATPVEPQEPLDRDGLLTSINPRSRFFSVLDLSNACLAIPLAPECWRRFAFTFRGRQFLFTRLPPRFRGTGSILHRRVAAMLARLHPDVARNVFHYSDDILITAKRRRQLRFRTRRVLQLIQSTGFKVNRAKAQLVRPEVDYLGMTLSAAGRRVPHEKLRQICQDCDAAGPWDPARLHSVLGKFNDLKEFIADYLELALPLQGLAAPERWEGERGREWQQEWEREGREQLRRLKEALKAAPALLFPSKCRPFVIRLSVHERTVGAALLQEKEGALLPLRHCSYKLSGQSWAPQDAACLAAVRAVQAFQKLTGPAPILIRGPAGRYLLRGEPLLDGCAGDSELPGRWRLLVTTKGAERKESQTVSIPLAPALRQLPADIPKANVWFLAVEKGSCGKQSVAFAAVSLEERWLLGLRRGPEEEEAALEALQELLKQHRSCRPLFLYCSLPRLEARLKCREQGWRCSEDAGLKVLHWLRSFPGMLQIRQAGTGGSADERRWMQAASTRARAVAQNSVSSRTVWEPSASERQEIVAQCHRRGHEGVEGTLRRVRLVCSWRNAREDAARWARRCPECQDGDPDADGEPAPQRERGPWSRLRLGLCAGLPQSPEGFRALLLVQDELSGWLDAFPLREPARAEVCRVLLREVFGRFGTVGAVLLEPKPAWLWELLQRPPLLGCRGRLERAEPAEAVLALVRVARALGQGWAAALPLLRVGIAAQRLREEELGALLCVPGLPLEVRWECPGCGSRDGSGDWGGKGKRKGRHGHGEENELQRLRAMEILEGYRQQVQNALG